MSEKHTPGPWTTDENDHDVPYQNIKITAGKRHTVCTVWIDDAPVLDFNAEQNANARLIAASPDLLQALQGMVDYYGTASANVEALEVARAALARAKIG